MKKGMKLRKCVPIITDYEDASGFPDEQSARSYCQEMNGRSPGWTVEKVKLGGVEKWRVVWLGERVFDTWEKKVGDVTVTYSTEGIVGVGYSHSCDCRRDDSITGTITHTSGKRLTRDEIEKLPSLVELVAQHT
jgi:hypothetical protein